MATRIAAQPASKMFDGPGALDENIAEAMFGGRRHRPRGHRADRHGRVPVSDGRDPVIDAPELSLALAESSEAPLKSARARLVAALLTGCGQARRDPQASAMTALTDAVAAPSTPTSKCEPEHAIWVSVAWGHYLRTGVHIDAEGITEPMVLDAAKCRKLIAAFVEAVMMRDNMLEVAAKAEPLS